VDRSTSGTVTHAASTTTTAGPARMLMHAGTAMGPCEAGSGGGGGTASALVSAPSASAAPSGPFAAGAAAAAAGGEDARDEAVGGRVSRESTDCKEGRRRADRERQLDGYSVQTLAENRKAQPRMTPNELSYVLLLFKTPILPWSHSPRPAARPHSASNLDARRVGHGDVDALAFGQLGDTLGFHGEPARPAEAQGKRPRKCCSADVARTSGSRGAPCVAALAFLVIGWEGRARQ